MKWRRRGSRLVLLAFLFLPFTSPAIADSDGCFCTFKGYIAFELRSFHTPGLHAEHILKIVRFEAGPGIYEAGEVPMKDFQVHEMRCTADRVELAGFDRGWMKYVIDIGQPAAPQIIENTIEPAKQHLISKEGRAPEQLGLSKPQVIALESADPDHKYQLVLSRSAKRVKDGIETTSKAELLRIDSGQNVSQRMLLYEDRNTEYPD